MKVKAISTLLTTISCDFKQCLRCIPSFACFLLLLNQQSNVILLFHANKAMQVSYYFKEFSSCYVICKLYYPNRKTWPRLPWIYIHIVYTSCTSNAAGLIEILNWIFYCTCTVSFVLAMLLSKLFDMQCKANKSKPKPKQTKPSRAEANKRDKCNSRPIRCSPLCSPWGTTLIRHISFCIVCIVRFDFISSAAVAHVSYAVYWIITKN